MAFGGYTIFRDNVFNTSVHDVFNTRDTSIKDCIIQTIKNDNHIGDVISVFEDDTEYDGTLIESWFNDSYSGWTSQYTNTDIELTTLENNGFFDC